jgi:CHAD domain-containing protein
VITRDSYREGLRRDDKALAKRVSAYLKDPNEKNVHDLRIVTRRVLAATQVLPKKIRSEKRVEAYAANLEKLMKVNAKTRDLDIVMEKVQKRSQSNEHAALLKSLEKLRGSSLEPGLRFAKQLDDLDFPVRSKDVSESDLEKRFEKVSEKYVSKIQQRLPTVVSSPDDKEELHMLREDVRRLRYVLDLAEQKSVKDQLETLKVWQEVLGEIHDSDVFIRQMALLKKPEEIGPMLEDEAFVRNRNYENFKSLAKTPLKLAN